MTLQLQLFFSFGLLDLIVIGIDPLGRVAHITSSLHIELYVCKSLI